MSGSFTRRVLPLLKMTEILQDTDFVQVMFTVVVVVLFEVSVIVEFLVDGGCGSLTDVQPSEGVNELRYCFNNPRDTAKRWRRSGALQ